MKRVNSFITKAVAAAEVVKSKIKENRGDSHLIAILVGVIIACVLGALLLTGSKTWLNSGMNKVGDSITGLFS